MRLLICTATLTALAVTSAAPANAYNYQRYIDKYAGNYVSGSEVKKHETKWKSSETGTCTAVRDECSGKWGSDWRYYRCVGRRGCSP